MRIFLVLLSIAVQGFSLEAQPLRFEAASIKVTHSIGKFTCTGGPNTPDPIRFTCPKATLTMLASVAYKTMFTQIVGPHWTNEDAYAYEVVATMPRSTSRDQFRVMLQNLLTDRFRLTVHKETRESKVYVLRVAERGAKMTHSVDSPDAEKIDDPINMKRTESQTGWHLEAKRQTMEAFSRYLSIPTWAKVIDETELSGPFDFSIDFYPFPELTAAPEAEGSQSQIITIFMAVKTLGLKLQPAKRPIEILVIDAADQTPTEN
jgi:uncharacterized protein (TIGR03435 family)